jgi:hypothetical protein
MKYMQTLRRSRLPLCSMNKAKDCKLGTCILCLAEVSARINWKP